MISFETTWAALAPHGLPAPVPEYRFHATRRWRFDYAWPDDRRGGVALEVDGGQWLPGGGRHGSDRDREKLNVAACLGWRVLRVSPRALADDPAGVVNLCAAALCLGRDDPAGGDDDDGAPGGA